MRQLTLAQETSIGLEWAGPYHEGMQSLINHMDASGFLNLCFHDGKPLNDLGRHLLSLEENLGVEIPARYKLTVVKREELTTLQHH